MPNPTNKVLFGFSDVYVGTYTVASDGTVTMGTPYHQAGAVGFNMDPQSEKNDFHADNVVYYSSYSGGTREGDLEVAMFDDDFKTQFLGYRRTASGGLAEIKGATKPNVYMAFAIQGDIHETRKIVYNGTFGDITRAYSTLEDTKEPVTESLPATFVGDNETGITVATYKPGDTGYDTLFTDPPAPELASE